MAPLTSARRKGSGKRSSSPSEPQANPQRTLRRPGPAGYTTQETDHAYTAAINRAKPTQP
jgi:hypothetical protein